MKLDELAALKLAHMHKAQIEDLCENWNSLPFDVCVRRYREAIRFLEMPDDTCLAVVAFMLAEKCKVIVTKDSLALSA